MYGYGTRRLIVWLSLFWPTDKENMEHANMEEICNQLNCPSSRQSTFHPQEVIIISNISILIGCLCLGKVLYLVLGEYFSYSVFFEATNWEIQNCIPFAVAYVEYLGFCHKKMAVLSKLWSEVSLQHHWMAALFTLHHSPLIYFVTPKGGE